MGFGEFFEQAVSAGASALGVSSDDLGGFFDQAKGVLDGEGEAGDLFSAAAEQMFGSGGSGGGGGGFGDALSSFLGDGEAGGAAQQVIGSFGSLLGGGGEIPSSVSQLLPESVTSAFSEAADLPFVQNAAQGDWASLAGSVPGLTSALGSVGLTTNDVASHVEGIANQAIDSGSAWSFGNMLADQGAQFLGQVATPMDADQVLSALPGLAQNVGVELPGWASELSSSQLIQQGGKYLDEGGFMPDGAIDRAAGQVWQSAGPVGGEGLQPAATMTDGGELIKVAPRADIDDTTGESTVAAPSDDSSLDEFSAAPANTGVAPPTYQDDAVAHAADADMQTAVQPVEADAPPALDDVPPPPEQFAAADELEGGLESLGDDAFDS